MLWVRIGMSRPWKQIRQSAAGGSRADSRQAAHATPRAAVEAERLDTQRNYAAAASKDMERWKWGCGNAKPAVHMRAIMWAQWGFLVDSSFPSPEY
jgi:hypothetical protein